MAIRTLGRPRQVGLLSKLVVGSVVLLLGVFALTGCTTIAKVKGAVDAIRSNKATVDAFTSTLQAGAARAFEATYVTTGSAPATIIYAVRPPTGVAFTETPSAVSGDTTPVHLVVNTSGEFACTQPSPSGAWSCQRLAAISAATENEIFDLYTPSHWVSFLRGLSLAAGLAGDTVTSSTMTVNGFALGCVGFTGAGVPGPNTICTTAQGILGYVKLASDSTSFEIQSFSASPPPDLFELPPGATVTSPPS
jgi:outer membrane murein-binding lipoprotein Lpp